MCRITEEEYALKFAMLITLDEKKIPEREKYRENFKYVLSLYSRFLRNNPGIVLEEYHLEEFGKKNRELICSQVSLIRKMCLEKTMDKIMTQPGKMYKLLFSLLAEALYRTTILIRFYAEEGEVLADIIDNLFFHNRDRTEAQISEEMNMSKATFYRKKQKAFLLGGYLFYQAVLPELEGKI